MLGIFRVTIQLWFSIATSFCIKYMCKPYNLPMAWNVADPVYTGGSQGGVGI